MNALFFLTICGGAYFAYGVASPKPERAIYGYLLLWLLFPKYIQMLPVLGYLPWDGVRIFEVLQAIAVLTLLVVCLFRPPLKAGPAHPGVSLLLLLFLVMTFVTYFWVYFFSPIGVREFQAAEFRDFVRPTLNMIYAVIFAWSCLRYIDTLEKVEMIFGLLVMSGIELTIEVIGLYYFNLVPGLRAWVMDSSNSGRFSSMAFLSFDTVGLISIVNISAAAYFILSRRKYVLAVLLVPMTLPIVATLSKGPFTGLLLALTAVVCLVYLRRRVVLLACTLVMVLGLVGFDAAQFGDMPNVLNGMFGGVMRTDNDVQQTLQARYGLWLRGIDIFLYNFPWGGGNGMISYNMAMNVPLHFENYVSGGVRDSYAVTAAREVTTNSHNMFIEFVAENGLLGLVVTGISLGLLARRFRGFLRSPEPLSDIGRRVMLAQACLYGALVGMGWRFLYEAGDKLYFLLFLMLYLAYLLPTLRPIFLRPNRSPGQSLPYRRIMRMARGGRH